MSFVGAGEELGGVGGLVPARVGTIAYWPRVFDGAYSMYPFP